MGRLRERDQQWVEQLQQELDSHRLGARHVWPSFLPLLARVLEVSELVAYGVERTDGGVRLAFVEAARAGRRRALAVRAFRRGFSRSARGDRGLMALGEALGLERPEQLHLVVWEHEDVAVSVGALRPSASPFTARERAILRRVLPALQKRLDLDHRLSLAPVHEAAVEICLETLDVPAAIIDAVGRIHAANTLARKRSVQEAAAFGAALVHAVTNPSSSFDVTPLRSRGQAYYLAIGKRPGPNLEAQLRAAAQAWGLTARETQTLGLVAEGLSSLSISARLSCAERTVEVHVGRLLSKARCKSRSQLIARFWSGADLRKQGAAP